MALSAEERLYIFEIFEFPPNSTVVEMWGPLGRANAVQQYSFKSPSDAIDTLIGLLSADQEELVQGLVAQWALVRTSEIELREAEGAKGMVTSAREKRMLIRDRLQTHIPLYLEGEIDALQRRAQYGGQRGGHIMRG